MPSDLNDDMAARDFIEFVVKAIVENPDDVEVTQTVDDLGVLITLKVNKADMGKIIERPAKRRSPAHFTAMMGSKKDARYNLKIVEPEGQIA